MTSLGNRLPKSINVDSPQQFDTVGAAVRQHFLGEFAMKCILSAVLMFFFRQ